MGLQKLACNVMDAIPITCKLDPHLCEECLYSTS